MADTSLPIDAITTLLDMVRGTIPFDLITAIKAALEIAEYVKSLFGIQAVPAAAQTMSLEAALESVANQHSGASAQAIDPSIWLIIIKLIMEWISQKMTP